MCNDVIVRTVHITQQLERARLEPFIRTEIQAISFRAELTCGLHADIRNKLYIIAIRTIEGDSLAVITIS